MCHQDTVVNKEGFLDEFVERVHFCFQTSKIDEGTVKAVSVVHFLAQILDSM